MNSWDTASTKLPHVQGWVKTRCGRESITPCNICASGSAISTTNSWKAEVNGDEKGYENIEIRGDGGVVCDAAWFFRDAPVELADARLIWLACDHVLASAGNTDSQQDPLWRISRPVRTAFFLASWHDGALGANDSRRAREVAGIHARTLRLVR